MILAVDIGNTNIVMGLLEGTVVRHVFRMQTQRDESVFDAKNRVETGLSRHTSGPISGAVVASVVPGLAAVYREAIAELTSMHPRVVGPTTPTGVLISLDSPEDVGVDRYVNLAALAGLGLGGIVVVDLGTATTFDVLSPQDTFLGGAIAPGLGCTANALAAAAPSLPRAPLTAPPTAVGRNTVDALRSGLLLGYVEMVDGLLRRITAEVPFPVTVYATGGLASTVAPHCTRVDFIDPELTLKGLARIYARG